MAARKHVYHFLPSSIGGGGEANGDEFEESDVVWGCHVDESVRTKPIRSNRKRTEKVDRVTAPASLPVNIPDWSKILKQECDNNNCSYMNSNCDEEEEEEVTGVVIPPHELLWRNRAASFSVHEGLGRTLKGRDLSRVRNAIFEKTGFQD